LGLEWLGREREREREREKDREREREREMFENKVKMLSSYMNMGYLRDLWTFEVEVPGRYI
jgi:hypothetical protein